MNKIIFINSISNNILSLLNLAKFNLLFKGLKFLLFGIVISSCSSNNSQKFYLKGKTMGTTYTIVTNTKIDKQVIEEELSRINNIFSNWIKDSEIEMLNNIGISQSFSASEELIDLINFSYKVSQQTDGYFDITIGNLIDIWGFGALEIDNKPSNEQIKIALNNSGINAYNIVGNKITKNKDIKFNLSALAKGYAVDRIVHILIQQKLDNFVVEIGGEVRVLGLKNIGIDRAYKKPIKVALKDQAIATSGDYRNYRIWDSEKFIHILDPKTGKPSNSDLISVSVIADKAFVADAYATAILAMGREKAIFFINKYRLKSILIDKENKIYKFNL